jgi:sigma-B regulation protein RsbU (phosphoserine phosphatase)
MGNITAVSSGNAIRKNIRANNTVIATLTARLVDERIRNSSEDIESLTDIIKNTIDPNKNKKIFLLGDDGRLLIDSDGNFINGSVNYNDSDDPGERFIARAVSNDDTYSINITLGGKKVYFSYAECSEIPVSVVVIVDAAAADIDVDAISESVLVLNQAITEEVSRTQIFALTVTIGAFVFAALSAMIMALRFAKNITIPIEKLTEEVSKINSDESLTAQIDIRTGDELEALADSFNLMTGRIHGFIAELEKSTSEKERVRAELALVKNLRDMAFPHIAPGYLDRYEIDIYGVMKENSGQGSAFYNYFPVAADKIAVITAEVSGSGITSAVKMLIAKTLTEQDARSGKSLDEIFYTINNILYEKEKTELQVSAFMGFINLSDGTFNYITAGMNPPFIKRKNEEFEAAQCKDNIALALRGNIRFFGQKTTLSRGDKIFIFSNSLPSAQSPSGEVFGLERLSDSLKKTDTKDIQQICDDVYSDFCGFADENQSEDIMMIAAEFLGKNIAE